MKTPYLAPVIGALGVTMLPSTTGGFTPSRKVLRRSGSLGITGTDHDVHLYTMICEYLGRHL